MNQRLLQLKIAAQNVTTHNTEKFSEIYGLLIFNDMIKVLQETKNKMPNEASFTPDSIDSWNMAMATVEIKLKEYFDVK